MSEAASGFSFELRPQDGARTGVSLFVVAKDNKREDGELASTIRTLELGPKSSRSCSPETIKFA